MLISAGVSIGTNLVNAVLNNALRPNTSSSGGININTGGQGCTSGRYYSTSDVTLLSDPCARYVAPTTTPPPGGCSVVDQILGTCSGTPTTTTNGADATNATLSVNPNTGSAPLTVTLTVIDTSSSCTRSPIMLSTGVGTSTTLVFSATNACTQRAPASYTYIYRDAGTYQPAVTNGNTRATLHAVTVIVTPAATTTTTTTADLTNASLSATPSSGTVPLAVAFTVTDTSPADTSPACRRSPVVLSAGDGSAAVTAYPTASTCAARSPVSFNYTYRNPGTFYATLVNSSMQKTLYTLTVVVSAAAGTSGTGTGTIDVSGSLLNIVANLPTGQTTSAAKGPPAGPPVGNVATSVNSADIQLTSTGVTIISGGVRDPSRNMGVSAFFGADTQAGAPSQNLAERICLVRPWQNPLITARIQPSIFDGLCTAKGFRAGVSVAAASAVAKPAPPKTPAATSTPATQPAVPAVPPAVAVWAVPASVPIGTRTSIFWNSRGVASCLLTSPDGSFSQNTLSGSASTVPLTGPTVYTISCLTPDGSHVTNFVKVDISS